MSTFSINISRERSIRWYAPDSPNVPQQSLPLDKPMTNLSFPRKAFLFLKIVNQSVDKIKKQNKYSIQIWMTIK